MLVFDGTEKTYCIMSIFSGLDYQLNSLGEYIYEIDYKNNYDWSSEENVIEYSQGKSENQKFLT